LYLLCIIHCKDLADYEHALEISQDFKRTVQAIRIESSCIAGSLRTATVNEKSLGKLHIIPLISSDQNSEILD